MPVKGHYCMLVDIINLLQSDETVYIAWKPVPDPKESNDGDAYFYTEVKK